MSRFEPFTVPVHGEAAWARHRAVAYRFFAEPTATGWRYGRVEVEPGLASHVVDRLSARASSRPSVVAHGWSGSIVEFDAIGDDSAEPKVEDGPAFHVIAPSLAGYVSPDKPATPIEPRAMAMYDRLSSMLGYDRYCRDWGCVIGGWIELDNSPLTALHLTRFAYSGCLGEPELLLAEPRTFVAGP